MFLRATYPNKSSRKFLKYSKIDKYLMCGYIGRTGKNMPVHHYGFPGNKQYLLYLIKIWPINPIKTNKPDYLSNNIQLIKIGLQIIYIPILFTIVKVFSKYRFTHHCCLILLFL